MDRCYTSMAASKGTAIIMPNISKRLYRYCYFGGQSYTYCSWVYVVNPVVDFASVKGNTRTFTLEFMFVPGRDHWD